MRPKNTPNCTCARCGATFYRSPSRVKPGANYCSVACRRDRVVFTCETCGRVFEKPASSAKFHVNRFCSTACKHQAMITDHIATILGRIDRSAGDDACWPYTGNLTKGYGMHKVKAGHFYAHRVAYEQARGPIAEGQEVHHTCLNRVCCNPRHLEALSREEHLARHREM